MNLINRIFNYRIALIAVLLIAVGYLSPPANAEEEEWKLFLNETPNESWYGYEVRCFLEDGEYMWVGARYGFVFKVFKETLEAVDTLNFSATDMTYDREGNIWFVGAGLKKIVGDTLIGWDQNNYQEIGLPDYSISNIAIDSTGNLWLGINKKGLVKFDGQSCKLFDDSNAPFKRVHPFEVTINSIAVDKNNNIWVTAVGVSGVLKYDHQNWTVFDSTNSNLGTYSYPIVVVDNSNNLWVSSIISLSNGTSICGLYKYDGTEWDYFDLKEIEVNSAVRSIVFDKDNNLWCSTNSIYAGLMHFDGINWTFYNKTNSSIFGNAVGKIYIDKKQNIWFAVSDYGDNGQQWKGQGVNIYRKGGVILNVDEKINKFYQVNTFPNPVNDVLTINSETNYNSYEIIDLQGSIILSDNFDSNKSIDVSSLITGTYCLRLINGLISKTVFFIKI